VTFGALGGVLQSLVGVGAHESFASIREDSQLARSAVERGSGHVQVAHGRGCGTNVTPSLNRPVLGQIRASATFTRSGNALTFIRLGQSSLSSCVAGTQLATGSLGTGVNGASRSVTASVNQNANWSDMWQRNRGSGCTNEGRYCELI